MNRSTLSFLAAFAAGVTTWLVLGGLTGPYVSNFGVLWYWVSVVGAAVLAGVLLYYGQWRTHLAVLAILIVVWFLSGALKRDITLLLQVLMSATAIAFVLGWFTRRTDSVASAH